MTVRRSQREHLFRKQKGKCYYCGFQMNWIPGDSMMCTGDHLKTRHDGGSDHISNLVAACAQCNLNRGRAPVGAFKQYVKLYGRGQKMATKLRILSSAEYLANRDMWDKIRGCLPAHNVSSAVMQHVRRDGILDLFPTIQTGLPSLIGEKCGEETITLELPHHETGSRHAGRLGRNYLHHARSLLRQEGQTGNVHGGDDCSIGGEQEGPSLEPDSDAWRVPEKGSHSLGFSRW